MGDGRRRWAGVATVIEGDDGDDGYGGRCEGSRVGKGGVWRGRQEAMNEGQGHPSLWTKAGSGQRTTTTTTTGDGGAGANREGDDRQAIAMGGD